MSILFSRGIIFDWQHQVLATVTHKYRISYILLDVLDLLAALLIREAVDVQDAHLLHDGRLAGLARAQQQQAVRRAI